MDNERERADGIQMCHSLRLLTACSQVTPIYGKVKVPEEEALSWDIGGVHFLGGESFYLEESQPSPLMAQVGSLWSKKGNKVVQTLGPEVPLGLPSAP